MAEGRYQKVPRRHTLYLADSGRLTGQPGGDNCIRTEESRYLQKLYLAISIGLDEVGGAVSCLSRRRKSECEMK